MIIEKIDIKCFGRLQNLSLEFSNRVNVIEGQNESGKSTIAGFIKYMLYGFEPTEESGEIGERSRRINWQSGVAEGSMNISVGGKKYLITRSTIAGENGGRVTYKEESSIIDLDSGTPAFGKRPAGEVFFGVDRELFENTAFLGQVGDATIAGGTVKEAIENILFSGSEKLNIQRAAARLSEKMESLYHPGKTGGAIFELVKKQEELEAALRSTDDANKQILAKEAELHEIRARREEAEKKREHLLDLDECYRNVMLIQTFDKLHELEEESDKAAENYNNFIKENTQNGFVPSPDYLTDLMVARRTVDDAYARARAAQDAYNEKKSAVGITKEIEGAIEISDTLGGEEKIGEKVAGIKKNKVLTLIGAIAGATVFVGMLMMIIAAAVGGTVTTLSLILHSISAALGIGGGTYSLIRYLAAVKEENELSGKFSTANATELSAKLAVIAEARKKRDTMIHNLEMARENLERAKLDAESARGELIRIAIMWGGTPPLAGFNEYLDDLTAKVRAFSEENTRLINIKNEMEITVREIRRTLADKSEIDIRAQVPPLKRKVLSEINHEEIITGIADARATIEEQQRLTWGVESDLADLKLLASDPGELYSKIQALDTKIDELRAKHKAYYVALSAINSASDNLRAEISPRLAEYAAKILAVLTDNKYRDIKINDAFKISFSSSDVKDKSVDYLSGGTRDLTYIAVRMALVDMLYTEKPPVCFDETFANQDNTRAASMMRAIGKLCDDGHQSFIFTCRAREGTLAKDLISGAEVYKLSLIGE